MKQPHCYCVWVHDSDNGYYTVYYTAVSTDRVCSKTAAGSLDYSIIDEDRTYILDGYTIPCEGVVNAWEFCYQVEGESPVTFYPGLWRLTSSSGFILITRRYSLIQSNNITFSPTGNILSCQMFNLSETEQFTAPEGSVVGLYSNKGSPRPLLLFTNNDNDITYQVSGNQTSVTGNFNNDVNYNIAIKVYIGKYRLLSV